MTTFPAPPAGGADRDATTGPGGAADPPQPDFALLLFVSGASSASARAIRNVQTLCEEYLHGRYDLTVLDVHHHRELARVHRVLATPTLVKAQPPPERMLVGEFSDYPHVLTGLGIEAAPQRGDPPGPGWDHRDG
jgi:circadian clock protein KaiB